MSVIVVGAGLAGLSAASHLVEAGRQVTVVEARGRLGGRVWTAMDGEHPIELGPEWVEPNSHLARLLREAGGHLAESDGRYLERDGDGWRESRRPQVVASLVRRLLRKGDADLPVTEALARTGRQSDLGEVDDVLLPYLEGFHAADPRKLSSRWLVEVEASQSADVTSARASQGLHSAVAELGRRLEGRADIRLNTPVTRIAWRAGHVSVSAGTSLEARSAIITLPLGVLQDGLVPFDPPLGSRNVALTQLAMGQVHKVVFAFSRPVWDESVPDDVLFLQDRSLPFATWWRPISATQPVLVGWLAGPKAEELNGLDAPHLIGRALDSLAKLLRIDRDRLDSLVTHVWNHNWNADPYSRGAYSYVKSGGIDAPAVLARPVENTLFFAGEATCLHGLNATMEGAILSGIRAAEEVLRSA